MKLIIIIIKYQINFYMTGYIKSDIQLQFAAAMISGIITCFTSIPIDVAKTR